MRFQPELDFYTFLGLKNFASPEEVKKRYRQLVMVHHPDRGGDEEKMKRINFIYNVLSKAKENYDEWLRRALPMSLHTANAARWMREKARRARGFTVHTSGTSTTNPHAYAYGYGFTI